MQDRQNHPADQGRHDEAGDLLPDFVQKRQFPRHDNQSERENGETRGTPEPGHHDIVGLAVTCIGKVLQPAEHQPMHGQCNHRDEHGDQNRFRHLSMKADIGTDEIIDPVEHSAFPVQGCRPLPAIRLRELSFYQWQPEGEVPFGDKGTASGKYALRPSKRAFVRSWSGPECRSGHSSSLWR